MKQRLVMMFLAISLSHGLWAQQGYDITIKVNSIADTFGLLAFHYGDQKLIEDTLFFNSEGVARVSGEEPLPRGIYLMVSPSQDYFEFLVADDQFFSIETIGPNYVDEMVIKGSEENQVFLEDLRYVVDQRTKFEALQQQYQAFEKSGSDSLAIIQQQLEDIDGNVKAYREALIKKHPDLFYAKFLASLKDPEVKEPINPTTGDVDSTYPYRYYKAHYFDNVDFSESGLLRTPIFENKIKTYIEQLTPQHPDSIIVSSDYLLDKSQANKEVFKYTLAWLLNRYAKREMMGFDAVYVHLAEKYYLSGMADWVDKKQLKRIREDALKMKPLLLGKIAPNITAKTQTGEPFSLYDVENFDYLIVWIWDADCGHCRKETPKLHQEYQTWKDKYNLKVFALTTELTRDRWDKFLQENDLSDWYNLIDLEGQDDFRDEYDVRGTPTMFILDSNFKIVGKRLKVEQIGGFLEFEEKKKNKGQ